MDDPSDPPQLTRVRRAKQAGRGVGSIDGGAIAVGLLVPIAVFAPTILGIIPPVVSLVFIAIAVFLGGFLAGRLSASTGLCGACHGMIVGALLVLIAGVVTATASLAGGEPGVSSPATLLLSSPLLAANAVVLSLGIGTLGGMIGMAERSTRNS